MHRQLVPKTSLVICSSNRQGFLRECVDSVLRGEEVPAELLIVDQSDAAERTLSELTTERSCHISYHWQQTRGLSRALNFAIDRARHDVLVFTHDDVEVERRWLSLIVRALLDVGPGAIVTGQVRPGVPEVPGGFVADVNVQHERAVYRNRLDRDVLFPMNMAMPRSVVDEVGPFDERLGPGTPFSASEDSDFAFRALEAGYSIVYEPSAVVHHRAWHSSREYVPLRWAYGVGRGAFYAKHLSLRDRYMCRRLLRDVRNHLASVPRLALRDRRKAAGNLALACGIVVGAARWLTTQPAASPSD